MIHSNELNNLYIEDRNFVSDIEDVESYLPLYEIKMNDILSFRSGARMMFLKFKGVCGV